jgi:hypothetical protein
VNSELRTALSNRFGEHRVQEVPVAEGDMPLLILDLELKSPVTVLMTNGLSNYKMPVPDKAEGREYNELFFCLPSYWEWSDLSDPRMNWPFHWIQRLAKYVIEKNTWFGHGHTMPCGADMKPLSDTMKQNHFFLSDPVLLQSELAPLKVGEKTVHFLGIIPIFPDEMDYKQGKGTFKFQEKLLQNGVTEKLDDYRGTILRSKWHLLKR